RSTAPDTQGVSIGSFGKPPFLFESGIDHDGVVDSPLLPVDLLREARARGGGKPAAAAELLHRGRSTSSERHTDLEPVLTRRLVGQLARDGLAVQDLDADQLLLVGDVD